MDYPLEQEQRSVLCSGRIVLECANCEERLVLLGCEEDWLSTRTVFECECGQSLSLAGSCIAEETPTPPLPWRRPPSSTGGGGRWDSALAFEPAGAEVVQLLD
jgi:hypothetical protein